MTATPASSRPGDLALAQEMLEHFEHIEVQFNQIREGLAHAHRLVTLGTIASMIVHEYSNILTPIISYTQMALANPDDRELTTKALGQALSGAERVAQISSSLLGFAREQDGSHCALLTKAVEDTIACLARDPARDGIELTVDVPYVGVAMSPLNLQQVLLNLILNARKAMGSTGGRLQISGRVETDRVLVDVVDSGPGIPDQIMDRLFEPFVTHRPDTSEDPVSQKGTGLGLCICRNLLSAAGGSITAENRAAQSENGAGGGAGATFHLSIPLADGLIDST